MISYSKSQPLFNFASFDLKKKHFCRKFWCDYRSVANSRSVQAGKELAEVLLTRQHGCRPVTLVGVSLGAKVIYQCLEEIHSRGLTPSQLGIIHNVVLVGAPCSGKPEDWARLAPLISGQVGAMFLNDISSNDIPLGLTFKCN